MFSFTPVKAITTELYAFYDTVDKVELTGVKNTNRLLRRRGEPINVPIHMTKQLAGRARDWMIDGDWKKANDDIYCESSREDSQ